MARRTTGRSGSRTPAGRGGRPARPGGTRGDDAPILAPRPLQAYIETSQRPLPVLVFLLPLVVAYEIALAFVLGGQGLAPQTVEAHRQLIRALELVGIDPSTALFGGGAVVVAVLLAWQVIGREPWRFPPHVLGLMTAESVLLTLPLLALGTITARTLLDPVAAAGSFDGGVLLAAAGGAGGTASGAAGAGDAATLAAMPLPGRLAIAIGAGVYEELLFRMAMIAALHALLVDLVRLPDWAGSTAAVAISAVAFAWYHDLAAADGTIDLRRAGFFVVAGVYFGVVFLLRGFGIVVAVHALYDIVTVLPGDG